MALTKLHNYRKRAGGPFEDRRVTALENAYPDLKEAIELLNLYSVAYKIDETGTTSTGSGDRPFTTDATITYPYIVANPTGDGGFFYTGTRNVSVVVSFTGQLALTSYGQGFKVTITKVEADGTTPTSDPASIEIEKDATLTNGSEVVSIPNFCFNLLPGQGFTVTYTFDATGIQVTNNSFITVQFAEYNT